MPGFASDYEAASNGTVSLSRQQTESEKMIAQVLVSMLDALSIGEEEATYPEAVRWVYARASATSAADQIEAIKAERAADKLASMRQPRVPRKRYAKPTPSQAPDATGAAMERDALLAGGQAAQHAAMARAGAGNPDADAHWKTRRQREEIYAKFAAEEAL